MWESQVGERIETELGVKPMVGVKESVEHMVKMIQQHNQLDVYNPRYYKIEWITLPNERARARLRALGYAN